MKREEMVFDPGEEGSVKKISCIPIKELEESLFYYIENAIRNNITQQVLRKSVNCEGIGDISKQNRKILQKDFTVWDKNTYLLQQISDQIGINQFGRVRMLMLNPKTTYSFHCDYDKYRVHIPIHTNENCFMVVDGKLWHLKPGFAYLVKVCDHHLALNAGETKRIHIVFDWCENLVS